MAEGASNRKSSAGGTSEVELSPAVSEISLPELEAVSGEISAPSESSDPSMKLELPPGSEGKTTQIAPTTAATVEEEKTDPGIRIPTIAPTPAAAPVRASARASALTAPRLLRPVARPATAAAPTPIPAPAATPRLPDLGVAQAFLRDPSITEILINDTRSITVERNGVLELTPQPIGNLDELNRVVRSILDVTGRTLTPEQPYLDTHLADGSRVNIVAPPLVLRGPCISIRKFPVRSLTLEDLIRLGSLDKRAAYFLNVCVLSRINILICGGTGSGKTSLLGALAMYIPRGERIVTIEDTPELKIGHPDSVQLQTKPASPGATAITTRELLANSLRMRPDRVIVGECRRGEALDMLQAMNTGHDGSMTTVHANSPRDGLARIETLCLMAGIELPLTAIRKQMASAIDLVVQVKRMRDGSRRVIAIAEVTGMEGETLTLQDIFNADDSGRLTCTGYVPQLIDRLRDKGIELPANYFSPN